MKNTIQPIASHCLVKLVKKDQNKTESGIILATVEEDFSEGIVLSIGNKLSEDKELFDKDLNEGTKVLFKITEKIYENINEETVLIPYHAIVAIIDKETDLKNLNDSFFDLPKWDDFKGNKYENWKDYSNIKSFVISAQFLTPFLKIDPLHKLSHEIIFDTIKKSPFTDLSLSNIKSIIPSQGDKHTFTTVVNHDTYGCAYNLALTEDGFQFDFKKLETDVQNIAETVPPFLSAYSKIMQSNLFKRYVEADFSKSQRLTMVVKQEIRLNGQGISRKPIKNSEAMKQFLKLQDTNNTKDKPLLEALNFSPESIGRIDIKISFNKEICGNDYVIFLDMIAPSNDNNSLIEATWTIVNENPRIVYKQDMADVFNEFFKKTILQGFYHRWFKENIEIDVTTLKK